MLDGQTQTARPGRAEHEPVRPTWEVGIGKSRAEQLVIGAEIVTSDARFRSASGTAGLENVYGFTAQALRDPSIDWPAAKPLVIEQTEP
jgi:hypothetical protein